MRIAACLFMALALSANLAGCGKRGPLTLPQAAASDTRMDL